MVYCVTLRRDNLKIIRSFITIVHRRGSVTSLEEIHLSIFINSGKGPVKFGLQGLVNLYNP